MASLFTSGKFQAINAAGVVAGARLYTYAAGTTTPLATYTLQAGLSSNANPVVCDANGQASVWLGTNSYRMILKDASDVTIWDTDNIRAGDVVKLADYGGDPTGVADSSTALTAALAASSTVDMSGGTWLISSSVTIPAGRFIDMRGANIVLACGATPGFKFLSAAAGLYMLHGGGTVTGTASSFLFCQGTTDTPSVQANYASQIHLESLWISSTTITTALVFDKAVKSVYIHGANFFTPNGINASGKCVEVMVSDSIIYGATGIAGTAGIKLRSTGGGGAYNEGWSIVNCTIDNFELCHDITDIFVYQIVGGYHGVNATLAATTGYTLKLQAPSTTLCEEITVGGGVVFAGRTIFLASGAGRAYNANIDATFTGVPDTAIAIGNNAANITIRGKWKAGTGSPVGVVGTNNNANIVVSGDFDSTYVDGVILNGAAGANCVIGPVSGPTSGDIVGAGRATILYRGVPIHSTGVASLNRTHSPTNLGGGATYAVAAAVFTLSIAFARGETGDLIVHLPYSGANAATQNLQFTLPTGMSVASGTGWGASNIYLGAATGLCSVRVPYYCTADGAGNLILTNQAGNTLTVTNQGWCGIVRNWA